MSKKFLTSVLYRGVIIAEKSADDYVSALEYAEFFLEFFKEENFWGFYVMVDAITYEDGVITEGREILCLQHGI